MGPANLAGLEMPHQFIHGDLQTQMLELLNDFGVALYPGGFRFRQHLFQLPVIQGKTVSQQVDTSGHIKSIWRCTGDFHAGDEIHWEIMKMFHNFLNPVNGIMIGQRNRPDTGIPGKPENRIRRHRPI